MDAIGSGSGKFHNIGAEAQRQLIELTIPEMEKLIHIRLCQLNHVRLSILRNETFK